MQDLSSRPFKLWVEGEEGGEPAARAHCLVIATGATARRLPVKGEDTFWQKGVSACAVCDGALPLFRNKPLAVVGGGDRYVMSILYQLNLKFIIFALLA